jgi:hypothetical protein
MRNLLVVLLGTALLSVLTMACGNTTSPVAPAPAGRSPLAGASDSTSNRPDGTKVQLCHRTGGANPFVPLTVAAAAVDAHIEHGDGRAGQPVPGMAGMTFNADCTFTPSRQVVTVTGTWNGTSYVFHQLLTVTSTGEVDATAVVSGFADPMRLVLLGYNASTNTCSSFFPGLPSPGPVMSPPTITAHWDDVAVGSYCLNVVPGDAVSSHPAPYSWTATIMLPQ